MPSFVQLQLRLIQLLTQQVRDFSKSRLRLYPILWT